MLMSLQMGFRRRKFSGSFEERAPAQKLKHKIFPDVKNPIAVIMRVKLQQTSKDELNFISFVQMWMEIKRSDRMLISAS